MQDATHERQLYRQSLGRADVSGVEQRGEHALKGVPGTWTILEAVDEKDRGGELLATSERSRQLSGRLMERLAYRSPRLARIGARAAGKLARR